MPFPSKTTSDLMNIKPPQNAALRTAIDLGVFELLVSQGTRGLSAFELSVYTSAERGLIGRTRCSILTLKLTIALKFD
jgi:hypothetical protein